MGLATIWLVGFVTLRFLSFSTVSALRERSNEGALTACALLSLTYGFYQMSTMAMVDMVFTFFVWAALAGLATTSAKDWKESRSLSRSSRVLFWLGCAGAVVARGPIGVVLPVLLASVVGVVVCGVRTTIMQVIRPSLGWLAFLIPAAWYYAAIARGGDAFVDRQLLFENVRRIVGGEHMNNQPFWFYLPSLLRTTFPWCVVLPFLALRRSDSGAPSLLSRFGHRGFSYERFLPIVACAAGVLLFSIPSGKRHSYMLPLYPLIAIQLAVLLTELVAQGGTRARQRMLHTTGVIRSCVVTLSALIGCGLGFIAQTHFSNKPMMLGVQPYLLTIAFPAAIVLLLGALPLLFRMGSKKEDGGLPLDARVCRVWYGLFALYATVICVGLGIKSTVKDYPGLARRVATLVPSNAALAVVKDPFEEYFDPILFYLRRDVTLVDVNRSDLPCAEATVYLARSFVLDAALPRFPGRVTVIRSLREFGDEVSGNRSREITAFTCDPLASNEASARMVGVT
jgi:hypothetical protein